MPPLLEVRELTTGYGKMRVLDAVSIDVAEGEIVALIGPNGAGKSTLLKAVFGLLPVWSGDVHLDGSSVAHLAPADHLANGMVMSLQGNRVFADMTVSENLEIGARLLPSPQLRSGLEEVFGLFPELSERQDDRADQLSGGEQQMVALARALLGEPRILMLDEPTLGLAPRLASDVFERLRQINAQRGSAMLVVEHRVRQVLALCHKVCALRLGRAEFVGSPEAISSDHGRLRRLFL